MTPTPRDMGDANMERALAILREELHRGFTGVNARLDALNGRVGQHGEQIATLHAHQMAFHRVAEDVGELSETLAAHRARCPYDKGGDISATAPQGALTWAAIGIGGGVSALLLMEVFRWVLAHRLGQ